MNPENRDDGFLDGKVEANFDIPTAKRKGFFQKECEDADTGNESAAASRGYFVRRTLREREVEEERQHKQSLRGPKKNLPGDEDEEYEDYEDEEESRTKAPPVVRIFAWGALLAIFFAGGYVGANYFFAKADKPGVRVGNVVGSGAEVSAGAGLPTPAGIGEASYKLYMPLANGDFEQREIKIRKSIPEDDIRHVLTVYIDGLKELTEIEPGVQVLNIFRSGDWLYVDMSEDFLRSLKTLGKDKSTLVLTGLVRTIQDNFAPIKKVKFYVDGKESREKNPVDLENAWELKS